MTPQGETQKAKATNMSVTGFNLSCEKPLVKNETIIVKVCLPKEKKTFELEAKVLRICSLPEDNTDYVYSIGVQIVNPSESWTLYAGRWIQSKLGSHTKRNIACLFLLFTGCVFAGKTALSALGLGAWEMTLGDFSGIPSIIQAPVFSKFFLSVGAFITTLTIFCGLQVLKPAHRDGFFFTSTAALSCIACFAPRLLLKLSLLNGSNGERIIYLFDFTVFIIGLAGAVWARRLEDRHRNLEFTLERENIYPPLKEFTAF